MEKYLIIENLFRAIFYPLGKFLILCCIFSLISTLLLFRITEDEDHEKDKTLKKELADRDSLHSKKEAEAAREFSKQLDSSNKSTINLLAKYSYKIDSSNKRIWIVS